MTDNALMWDESSDRIMLRRGDAIIFDDSVDHWRNGVLRLLSITEAEGRAWSERAALRIPTHRVSHTADLSCAELVDALREAWDDARPHTSNPPADLLPLPHGNEFGSLFVLASGLRHDSSAAVVGTAEPRHGWLVDVATGSVLGPPVYEEEYFEGSLDGVGYGSYDDQSDWRIEKAFRQIAQCEAVGMFLDRPAVGSPRLLDVGSGYGYFRYAAQQHGWLTDGIDVSAFGAARAQAKFNLRTHVGTLEGFTSSDSYDLVTLWDCIEHVENPAEFFVEAAGHARAGALLMLRTPNIEAIEFDVFGRDYHSLKREHLHYFSARSLVQCARSAGLIPRFVVSESHLFRGFSSGAVAEAAATLRGSDLFAAFEIPG